MTYEGATMNIPEELTESVARAIIQSLREDEQHDRFGAWVDCHEDEMTGEVDGKVNALLLARAALSAAAPMLMAIAWDEGMNLAWDLAAETEPRPGHSWRVDWMNRMEHEVERNPYRKEQS